METINQQYTIHDFQIMEREIKRNRQGRILSYEITSSNLEYGKVFLEPFVEKFDEDSYNEEYPLPQRDEFELPFNQVFVSFDVTQVSFPAFQFQYLTSSGGPPTPMGSSNPNNISGSGGDGSSGDSSGTIFAPFGVAGQYQGELRRDSYGLIWNWNSALNSWIRQ